ncbi:enoyl-CoA hydratase/isomerase family protein, partial [Singulisphaera rosea]
MSTPLVSRSEHGPVVVLTLNRPERRNALSRQLIAELSDALGAIALDQSARALVLSANGPVFCAGMDMKEAVRLDASPESERRAIADVQSFADLIGQVHHMPKATIAALD